MFRRIPKLLVCFTLTFIIISAFAIAHELGKIDERGLNWIGCVPGSCDIGVYLIPYDKDYVESEPAIIFKNPNEFFIFEENEFLDQNLGMII